MTAFVAFRKNFWYEQEGAQIFFFFLLELLSLLKNFFSSKEKKNCLERAVLVRYLTLLDFQ